MSQHIFQAGYEACYAAWLFTFCREGPLHVASSVAAGYVSLFWAALTAGRVAAAGAAATLPPHAVLLASLPLAVLGARRMVAFRRQRGRSKPGPLALEGAGRPQQPVNQQPNSAPHAGPVCIVTWPTNGAALTAGLVACGLGVSAGFANSVSLLARVTPVSPTTQARL